MHIGFWENFAPSAHSRAHTWSLDGWRGLLDEFAANGVRVLTIYLHWYTTGYRSLIPFLDATPSANADSGNALLSAIIAEAHRRAIAVHAANHLYIYHERLVRDLDRCVIDDLDAGCPYWPNDRLVTLSPDSGHTREIVLRMFEEQLELFPELDGFVLEGERKYLPGAGSRRAYDRWAADADAPAYELVRAERFFEWLRVGEVDADWVRFVSHREGALSREILGMLRSRGFRGQLHYCYGTSQGTVDHMLDADVFAAAAGDGVGVAPYDYDHPTGPQKLERIAALRRRFPLMYVVDGQVGWHRAADERSRDYMTDAWRAYVRHAQELQADSLVFFGADWNALRNSVAPLDNRRAIYRLVETAGLATPRRAAERGLDR